MRQAKIDQAQRYEETIEALRRAEQKYRSIFENATEGIFQTTPEGKYLSANPALARMYGYDSPGELLADLTDISRQLYVEPGRRRKFTLAMRSDGHIRDFESEIYRRDGSVIWISENARAVHDEVTGELLYYEGMVQDITRRKAAEEARKQAEEKLVRYAQELRVKNAQFEADLEMAREIQQVFLMQNYPSFPRSLTPEESWLGFCHWYQPAEQVGGDFFCVLPLSDTEAGVFICDVLGHGLRAALVTAIVRGLLEELTPIATNPGRLLCEINGSLMGIFRQIESPCWCPLSTWSSIRLTAKCATRMRDTPDLFIFNVRSASLSLCDLRGLKVPYWGFFRRQRIRTVMEPLRQMIWSCSLPTVYSRSRRPTTNITAQTDCWLRCASECTFPPDSYLAN
jgi:PAS domain S-box-containing protein